MIFVPQPMRFAWIWPALVGAKVDSYLHLKTPYPCFTKGLIGIISSPHSSERWAHMSYRLRGCDEVILAQENFSGRDLRDLALFLPIDQLERIMSKSIWFWRWIRPDKGSRRAAIQKALALTYPYKRKQYEEATSAVLMEYDRGDRVALSLYYADMLALWKLQRLDRLFPQAPSPCFLIMEDDTIIRPAYWHVSSTDQLCRGFEVTQLFYHHMGTDIHRGLALNYTREYLSDGVVPSGDMKEVWSSSGMLWNTATLNRVLEDMSFDEDDPNHPFLNCTQPHCFPDHLWEKPFKAAIPATPIVTPQLAVRSTYRDLPPVYAWQSAQSQWAAFYQAEVMSLKAVTTQFLFQLFGFEAANPNHLGSAIFLLTNLNTTLGAITIQWIDSNLVPADMEH
eukprot:Protomagalhaensia_sp_Gyna_25__2634@NODE_24_length_7526_cov_33_797783_g17_i0_p5_GENE_NODE_24_length_7526_cov_33_797783_g17_i0NODE_24_length_7526_cov_33_797783_g17_i0_p5_ORF_typecomplete_len394_score46_91_NODE_24_length_7526_cov_33_797783_g17_i050696250